jgi:hypothetical protein
LRELPQGRAVAFISGTPAVLVEPQPWFRSDQADVIEASIRRYAPTIGDASSASAVTPTSAGTSTSTSTTTSAVAESPWNVKAIKDVSAQ